MSLSYIRNQVAAQMQAAFPRIMREVAKADPERTRFARDAAADPGFAARFPNAPPARSASATGMPVAATQPARRVAMARDDARPPTDPKVFTDWKAAEEASREVLGISAPEPAPAPGDMPSLLPSHVADIHKHALAESGPACSASRACCRNGGSWRVPSSNRFGAPGGRLRRGRHSAPGGRRRETARAGAAMTVLTVAEVAERWRCAPATVRGAIARGEICCVRFGRVIRVSAATVDEFECRQHTQTPPALSGGQAAPLGTSTTRARSLAGSLRARRNARRQSAS